MIPTRRLVLLLAVPLTLATGAYFVDGLLVTVLAVDLVLVVIATGDLLLNRASLEASREVGHLQSVGRAFTVHITLANPGGRTLSVEVEDDAPDAGCAG